MKLSLIITGLVACGTVIALPGSDNLKKVAAIIERAEMMERQECATSDDCRGVRCL
jgi:hypothetical protein